MLEEQKCSRLTFSQAAGAFWMSSPYAVLKDAGSLPQKTVGNLAHFKKKTSEKKIPWLLETAYFMAEMLLQLPTPWFVASNQCSKAEVHQVHLV